MDLVSGKCDKQNILLSGRNEIIKYLIDTARGHSARRRRTRPQELYLLLNLPASIEGGTQCNGRAQRLPRNRARTESNHFSQSIREIPVVSRRQPLQHIFGGGTRWP